MNIGFDTPLEGVRVLDLSRLLPGPFATMVLGDMGAEIIKVEGPPGGDYARWYPPMIGQMGAFFGSVNRNKKSITLDLKTTAGVEILHRLAASADVVFESFRPGVADRLGVGFEALSAINEKLIYCSISGFGADGPLARRAGHDVNYLALSGTLHETGASGGPPIIPGFQLADLAGGALYAIAGVTAGLLKQERSKAPKPIFLDISMTEGALSLHGPLQAQLQADANSGGRGEAMLNGGLPCYQIYETSDQKHLAVGSLEPKFWAKVTALLGLDDLAFDGVNPDPKIRAQVAEVIATKTRDEWASLFAPLDACVEPVLSPLEVRSLPLHTTRGVFFSLGEAGNTDAVYEQLATPLTPRDPNFHRPPPVMGADNQEILADLGCSEQEIADLSAAGAFGS